MTEKIESKVTIDNNGIFLEQTIRKTVVQITEPHTDIMEHIELRDWQQQRILEIIEHAIASIKSVARHTR